MHTISEETVEQVWQEAKAAGDDHLEQVIGKLNDEQPLLLAYLISVGEELLNEDEQELLFFFGVLLWEMMNKGETLLPEMTEDALNQAEQENVSLLERLEDEPEAVFRGELSRVLEGYSQPHLLNFVVEVVTEAAQDGDIRPRNYGPLILYLKTVIDGLDADLTAGGGKAGGQTPGFPMGLS